MDRSFLSRPEVIAASQDFVCVRLATYESAPEAEFLTALAQTGSGELENTVVTILSPDGKRQLVRGARSPRQVFANAGQMAQTMNRIAARYRAGMQIDWAIADLPAVADVRLAIDIAACDGQPLVILFAKDKKVRTDLSENMKSLAWSDEFRGRFVYVKTSEPEDLEKIRGVEPQEGVVVAQSDRFGLSGAALSQVPASAPRGALADGLRKGINLYQPVQESFSDHVRAGRLAGILWDTKVPVTDPMERLARQRGR
jgi:hypothetical protein